MNPRWSAFIAGTFGLLAVAAGLGSAWQAHEAAFLRAELKRLRGSTGELERLRTENQRLRAQDLSPAEIELLRCDQAALPRLRAEIQKLKTQAIGDAMPMAPGPSLRIEIEERYAGLFERLQLTPELRERAIQLIIARYATLSDQSYAAVRRGQSPYTAALQESAHDAQIRLGAQLEMEFGADVADEYRRFEWGLSARTVVVLAVGKLAGSTTPLTDDQKARLFTLLLAQSGPGFPGRVALGYFLPPYSNSVEITEQTLKAAATVLAPEQLKVLELFRTQQRKASD